MTHPILLGEKSALNKFHLATYPAFWWIDHDGKIVEVKIGSEPGDEQRLAAQAEKMLSSTRQIDSPKR